MNERCTVFILSEQTELKCKPLANTVFVFLTWKFYKWKWIVTLRKK